MLLPHYQKDSKARGVKKYQPLLVPRPLVLAAVIVLTTICAILRPRLSSSKSATHYSTQDFADDSVAPPALQEPISGPTRAPLPIDPTELPAKLDAQLAVDALFARQSSTLADAISRYELRTNRPPPPHYDSWFQYAQDRKCLIDEYDQIHRDFEPFYELAERDPGYFRRMIERAQGELAVNPSGICAIDIRDGIASSSRHCPTSYVDAWPITFDKFSRILPDTTFLISSSDEPRVVFNTRDPAAFERALANATDETPFHVPATAEFFGCQVPNSGDGFMRGMNAEHSFLLSTWQPGYTTDLYPMLSMAKVTPCFSDILFPGEYYYDRSWWSGKFGYPDIITPWEDKQPKLYWRGASTGGQIVGSNYHHFTRFKLVKLASAHPTLMDVKITHLEKHLCDEASGACDAARVVEEYNITGKGEPREDVYEFKYAMDVDGMAFSGRFLGLLRSGSLVFKATIFTEYFSPWIRPFEHYIPVKPDLSDLVQRIEWANANPVEARRIQQRGLAVAKRVLTDEQNDCYFAAMLLEWARLSSL